MKNKVVILLTSIIAVLIVALCFNIKNLNINNVKKLLGDVSYPTSNGVKLNCDKTTLNVDETTTCTLTGFLEGGTYAVAGQLETQGLIEILSVTPYQGWGNLGATFGETDQNIINYNILDLTGNQFIVATLTLKGVGAGSATLKFVGYDDSGTVTLTNSANESINVSDATLGITVSNGSSGGGGNTPTPDPTPSQSSNANLSALEVIIPPVGGNRITNFNQNTTSYNITTTSDSTAAVVTATKADTNASVSITDNGNIDLSNVTSKVVNIVVTAQNGSTKTYKVTITKEQAPAKSSDNTLKSLKFYKDQTNQVAITPTFSSGVTTYSATVENNVTSGTVVVEPNDDKATVTKSRDVTLNEGLNTVNIKVTAENGTTKDYVLKITRKEAENISDDTTKSKINTLKSISAADAQLVPTFDNTKEQEYVLVVNDDLNTVTIVAEATDTKAQVKIPEITFDIATFKIYDNIIVTAENGSKKYYPITVVKKSYYESNKDEFNTNTSGNNDTTVCDLKLTSSVYEIDNDKLTINRVNKAHSLDTIRSNISTTCGNIMVNENKVVLSTSTQIKEYTINRVWMPQTGQKVVKYTLAIVVILAAIVGLIILKKKINK